MTGNLSASILTRLLTLAKQRGDDYSLLLNRFGWSACWPASARRRMPTASCSRAPCSLHSGTTLRTARRGTPTCWASAPTMRRT
jgi:hypothetical protein